MESLAECSSPNPEVDMIFVDLSNVLSYKRKLHYERDIKFQLCLHLLATKVIPVESSKPRESLLGSWSTRMRSRLEAASEAKMPRNAICVGVGVLGASGQLTMYSWNQAKCGEPAHSEHIRY